jgi:hypothetical protein
MSARKLTAEELCAKHLKIDLARCATGIHLTWTPKFESEKYGGVIGWRCACGEAVDNK